MGLTIFVTIRDALLEELRKYHWRHNDDTSFKGYVVYRMYVLVDHALMLITKKNTKSEACVKIFTFLFALWILCKFLAYSKFLNASQMYTSTFADLKIDKNMLLSLIVYCLMTTTGRSSYLNWVSQQKKGDFTDFWQPIGYLLRTNLCIISIISRLETNLENFYLWLKKITLIDEGCNVDMFLIAEKL